MEEITGKGISEVFFVARQPIFNVSGEVWGYEILFRSKPEQGWVEIEDPELATFAVSTCGFIRTQEDTDQDKKIFINYTEKLILEGAPIGLPPTVTVVEVLENIQPSEEIIKAIITLKQEGFLIAIDDYVGESFRKPLLEYADIIKVEVMGKSEPEIRDILAGLKNIQAVLLAEKVEDRAFYKKLKELGFNLFQGYYFAKPEILSGRKLRSSAISKLRILEALETEADNAKKLAEVVGADPSITYRMLRFLNSAAFGFSVKIDTVQRAVMLLGTKRVKYWLRMVVMSDLLGPDKTPELYIMALNRGRLLEELATEGYITGAEPQALFLFGMLSLIEAMLDVPFADLAKDLPLPKEMLEGYLDKNPYYHSLLDLCTALEHSDLDLLRDSCRRLQVDEKDVAEASVRAMVWTDSLSRHIL